MHELHAIVTELERAQAEGKRCALATVVGVEGSGYRLPGARMLIVDGRWVAGSISGGCLEDDVVLRAQDAIARNEPQVAVYDTTRDDDVIFGVGLGCKGVITILIEPLPTQRGGTDYAGFVKTCLETRTTGHAATVVRASTAKTGARLLLGDRVRHSDMTDARLAAAIETRLRDLTGSAELVELEDALVFLERVDPPPPLVVFGAGHDAIPVVRFAKQLGWHVTVVDHRPAYMTAERFPEADRLVLGTPETAAPQLSIERDNTLALVMTHNYLRDMEWLERLLPQPLRYLGLLGPRRRTESLLADLKEKGIEPARDQLDRLYGPVGLDIGSEGPAEVALSILAEMHAVLTNHSGGHLRARKQPIHRRASAEALAA